MLDGDFTPELELCDCLQIGKLVGMIDFGSEDQPEVASVNLEL